jgi:hypothetical protein
MRVFERETRASLRRFSCSRRLQVCYTGTMFIHHISITGCSDRGAWPWRTLTVMPELITARHV